MRGISIKALLISGAAYFVILFILLVIGVAGVTLVVMANNLGISGSAAAAILGTSGLDISVILFSSGIAAIAAGYIAGRIAGRDYVLNGVVALSIPILVGLALEFVGMPTMPTTWRSILFSIVMLAGSPVLSLFGAQLARRQQLRRNTMSAGEQAAQTYKAAAVAIIRWILALTVGMTAYAGILTLVPLAFGRGLMTIVFATSLAIIFATSIVPASHRRNACMLFIAITILLPTEEFARHALLGRMRSADGVVLLLYTTGALFAYMLLRRRLLRQSGSGGTVAVATPISS
jgi:hypothetical protein